jgi:hypothetical protein
MIRYRDTFVITHTNINLLKKINSFLTSWLHLNFKIPVSKLMYRISELKQGFDFLGYRFIKIFKNGKIRIHIYPTKKSQKYLIWLIGSKCRTFRGVSLFNLIDFLKPKIVSWAFYFRYVECRGCLKKIDYLIFLIINY